VEPTASRDDINTAYRRLASEAHPDKGGSAERMAEINRARDEALRDAA
jgi:curved DNA-binding protein CbpA